MFFVGMLVELGSQGLSEALICHEAGLLWIIPRKEGRKSF